MLDIQPSLHIPQTFPKRVNFCRVVWQRTLKPQQNMGFWRLHIFGACPVFGDGGHRRRLYASCMDH
jgi:hypothetical protein